MRSGLDLLFVVSSVSWGGLEMNILKVAYEMQKRGHKVTIMCNPEGRLFKEAGGDFDVIEFRNKSLGDSFKIYDFLKRNNVDVIHIYRSSDLKKIVFSVSLIKRKPALVFDPQVGIGVKKKDLFHRFVYGKLNVVIAISRDVAHGFMKNLPVDERKVKIIHPGVDVERFKFTEEGRVRIRREFNLGDEIVIGVVSRFSPGKGHEELFRAFKILTDEFKNVKLLVVGEPTVGEIEYFKRLQKLNKELGIENYTIWTGFRRDVPEVLSAIDIFVAPSHAEAFGLSLVEAMAVGLPVVATRNAGFLDIIEDGMNGLFFERGNYVELAEKIKKLMIDKLFAQQLGKRARETACEKFSFEKYINEIEKLYFDLIESKQTEVENVQYSKA